MLRRYGLIASSARICAASQPLSHNKSLLVRHHVRSRALGTAGGRPLVVLGLESSADDSCASIVTSDRRILSNAVVKQHTLNAQYGGIHPMKAIEAHQAGMPLAIEQCLRESQMAVGDVDAIAYTRGPGMTGCLAVGATTAKALAAAHGKPLYGIHHMQAHALTPLLTEPNPPPFPFLVLLVSGGHTQLVLCGSLDSYSILLNTLDNSIGNVFDKVARALQLPTSANKGPGAVLEEYANRATDAELEELPTLTLPLRGHSQKAFSFAGLFSETDRLISTLPRDGDGDIPDDLKRKVSRAFQATAVEHLARKVGRELSALKDVTGLVVSGGVACNQYLRGRLETMLRDGGKEVPLFYPPVELCTDNAAMIAWTTILRIQAGAKPEPYHLPLRPKWSLEALYDDYNT